MARVSIIMGIYNCADTLPKAIDSILAQTYTDWELIMCDDCSTDSTYAVAESYQKQYPEKIVLIKNESNKKLAFTLNHCLEYAKGEYIARMDGDDISIPERLEKQINFLQANPEYQLVGTLMQRFNEDGLADIVGAKEEPDKYTIITQTPFNHATILTYKYVYDNLDNYTVAKRTERCEDYDLWFKFFAKGYKGYNLQEPLYLVKEDIGAIKRRTAKSRLQSLETTKIGYKMLGFPRRYYIKAAMKTYFKCLIPVWLMNKYRKKQKQDYVKKNNK